MNITNVLVVDDDIAVCRILHRMLSDEQYTVQTCQSVSDALGAIEQKPFDVYVMDYNLPDGSGLDVADRIRSKGSQAPIILISGYRSSVGTSRAEKLCITDFLAKPFSREIICDAMKKAIGSAPAAASDDKIMKKDVSLKKDVSPARAPSSTRILPDFRHFALFGKRTANAERAT
jgi:two-component system response regulator HydG